jgi:hypothetical protein
MKVSFALVVCVVVVVALTVLPAGGQPVVRVRALDVLAEAALERGRSDSSLFRELVAELEASDVIVHVITAVGLPATAVGTTRLSSAGPQHRYVRVTISADLPAHEQTAILGHELQHACEIARSPARDTATIRTLYQSIGQRVDSWREAYETTAAIEAGLRVWSELHSHSHRTAAKTQEQ